MEILPKSFQDVKFIGNIVITLIATGPKNIRKKNKKTAALTAWSSNYFQNIVSKCLQWNC